MKILLCNEDFLILRMQQGDRPRFKHSSISFCKLASIVACPLFFYPPCLSTVSCVLCVVCVLSRMFLGSHRKLRTPKHSCWSLASFWCWSRAENDSTRQSTSCHLLLIVPLCVKCFSLNADSLLAGAQVSS